MILLYIGIGVMIVVLGLSTYIAKSIFHPKKWDYQYSYDSEVKKGLIDAEYLKKYLIEDVYINNDGNKLHAHLINIKSDKTIIMMHGHTFTLFGGYKYAKIFLELGYNILMPDQRYHGLSEGKNTTLGYKESNDLEVWTNYIKAVIPKTKVLGYHGESMGAATVLLQGHNKNIDFIISDCGFSDFKKQTQELLWKNYKIPSFMVYPVHIMSKLLYGAPLINIKPINNLKNIKVPILFVHGDSDSFINISHMEDMLKEANQAYSYICKDANHAMSLATNFDEYNHQVITFLQSIKK